MNRAVATAGLALAFALGFAGVPAHAGGSTADVDAAARAGGNRKDVALRIGRTLFATVRPAQLIKVRVDGAGRHDVAGLVVSGVKFHRRLDDAAFTREVVDLIRGAFASSDVEEVDVWATVPLPYVPHEIVGGDLAAPTSRIVYGATVVRAELGSFAARLLRGDDVYWDPSWRAALARQVPLPDASGKG